MRCRMKISFLSSFDIWLAHIARPLAVKRAGTSALLFATTNCFRVYSFAFAEQVVNYVAG